MFQTQHVLGLDFSRPNKTVTNYRFMKYFWRFDVKNREHHQSKERPFPAIYKRDLLILFLFSKPKSSQIGKAISYQTTGIYTRLTSLI